MRSFTLILDNKRVGKDLRLIGISYKKESFIDRLGIGHTLSIWFWKWVRHFSWITKEKIKIV